MSPHKLTIKLAEFNDEQRGVFQSVLNLAEPRLQAEWQIVEDNADVCLFPQKPAAADLAKGRCLFYSATPDLPTCILISENGLPGLSSVIAVLNSLNTITPVISDTATAEIAPVTAPLDGFDPNQGLLHHLLLIKASGEPSSIVANNINILIDPVAGLYYASITLEEFIFCSYPDVEVFRYGLAQSELQHFVNESQLSPRPLSDLIWYITIKTSQGQLLAGHSPDDIVTLKYWPNLKLPECLRYMQMAAFMHSNALPLKDIANKLKLPLDACYNFYNACYLTDLIEKPTAVQIHTKPISAEQKHLFDAIKNRIN
jgi:hypothetical protein